MGKGNAPPRGILVVGGAGGLGSEICRHLCNLGERVIAVDNVSTGSLVNIEDLYQRDNFTFIREDISKLDIPGGIRKIIFLPNPDKSSGADILDTNIDGLINCLDYCSDTTCRMLYCSSPTPLSPIDGSQMSSAYYLSRQYGESLVRTFYEKFNLPTAIVRVPSVYGAQHIGFSQIVCKFINEAANSGEINVLKDPNSSRAYLHISDFIASMSEIVKMLDSGGLLVLNLPGSEVKTASEVAKEIAKEIKKNTGKTIAISYSGRRYTHKRSVVSRGPSPIKNRPRIKMANVLWRMIESKLDEMQ